MCTPIVVGVFFPPYVNIWMHEELDSNLEKCLVSFSTETQF